jgi:hypothetical protein
MAGLSAALASAVDAAARRDQRQALAGLTPWERHQRMMRECVQFYGGQAPPDPGAAPPVPQSTDLDALRGGYRFIRTPEDDAAAGAGGAAGWEARLARRYYSRLFREYAIADLSRHREGRVGLRWRTQGEVVAGAGQFSCGARGCVERRGLGSFEVPFAYTEAGERKRALVKVRLCPDHAYQLNYRKNEEAERQREEAAREGAERRRRRRRGEERGEKMKKRRRRSEEGAGDEAGGGAAPEGAAQGAPEGAPAAAAPHNDEFEQFCSGLFL